MDWQGALVHQRVTTLGLLQAWPVMCEGLQLHNSIDDHIPIEYTDKAWTINCRKLRDYSCYFLIFFFSLLCGKYSKICEVHIFFLNFSMHISKLDLNNFIFDFFSWNVFYFLISIKPIYLTNIYLVFAFVFKRDLLSKEMHLFMH